MIHCTDRLQRNLRPLMLREYLLNESATRARRLVQLVGARVERGEHVLHEVDDAQRDPLHAARDRRWRPRHHRLQLGRARVQRATMRQVSQRMRIEE